MTLVSDPKSDKSGNRVLFTVTRFDLEGDRYVSNIWMYRVGEDFYDSVTSGPSDFCPEWSPDGRRFLFLSRRGFGDDEPGSSIWISDLIGEPRELIKSRDGFVKIRWAGIDKVLVIERVGEREEDVKHIDALPVWFNGVGYVYSIRNVAYVVDVDSGFKSRVTPEGSYIVDASISPDGTLIAYIERLDELRPYEMALVVKAVDGSWEKRFLEEYTLWSLEWSDNGLLAVLGHNRSRGLSSHNKIYVVDPRDDRVVNILKGFQLNVSNTVNSDVRGPSCSSRFIWVGDEVVFQVSEAGKVVLYRAGLDIEPEKFLELDNMSIDEFSVAGRRVFFTAMGFSIPKELYVYDESIVKVTRFNNGFIDDFLLVEPEHFKFRASDGVEIDGWIYKPDGEGPFPWILYIHGGPKTMFGYSFMEEFQLYVSSGYAVVITNPRGSDGYTEEFADIRGKYGERDYDDLMEAVDYVLERYPFLDRDRFGVAGGSYGGFMTNWVVTHTDRFRAAVTMRSICDWISMFGTTDIGFYFVEDQIGCTPIENIGKCVEKSPITYVSNVKTPTLIIHSVNDFRCWLDQALLFYTALKKVGVETRLVIFPNEDHDLSRKGKPKHRVERLWEILRWFGRWLGSEVDN